jgi:3-(3-hydroxy-phenyl)propionate hydroxylase
MAIDLAGHGIDTVLLDEDDKASEGSRAICFAKRTLEILDRLGVGERAVDKGVVWNVGKVFLNNRQLYQFDLLPESGHKRPAFINLQQYYLEEFLIERLQRTGRVDLRWRNRVSTVAPRADGVAITVDTPDGQYVLECDYLIAADGSRSPIRTMLGLEAKGQVFRDRFLIADVKMQADFPTERWFWFDPPFHPNQSVLLHKEADDVWRIDFQRMERFRHGRIFFVGDAAHQVSPFGARGANSGIQDSDNLAWKLALVLEGLAAEALLDSYDAERIPAADENILNSTRSTDFITPKSKVSRMFRDAALQLAEQHSFARRLVNSGRLSVPHTYRHSPLDTLDHDSFGGRMQPGAPALDAPLAGKAGATWLMDQLGGGFVAVYYHDGQRPLVEDVIEGLRNEPVAVEPIVIAGHGHAPTGLPEDIPAFVDAEGTFAQRYDATPGCVHLFRPDQHLTARWRHLDLNAVRTAVSRAACLRERQEAAV